jgi:signal transduction histidine kinase
MLPIALATLGLVALGVAQGNAALRAALDARRGQAVASTALAALRLNNLLEQEIAEGDRLRARNGQASALLKGATEQTDRAVGDFRKEAETTRSLSPSLGGALDVALAQLNTLDNLRTQVAGLGAEGSGSDLYDDVRNAVLTVADALPATLSDTGLAATSRAVAAIARAEHYAGEQRELLHLVLEHGGYAPGQQAELDRLVGGEDERIAEFNRDATPEERSLYNSTLLGPDVNLATSIRTAALQPDPAPSALHADPDAWYIAQSNLIRRLHEVQSDLARTLDQTSRDQEASATNRAILTGVATIVIILIAFGAALAFAVRTGRRLRRLRRAALRVAGFELPSAITELNEAADQAALRQILNASAARADALSVAGGDEIGEVGSALSTVHRQALRLAADQAALRQDVAGMFIALSRRGQTLIARQLQLIAEFETMETDRDSLQRLFALSHLATRMRRNEENLLVLAGGEVGGRILAPVALIEVIRAAAAEIEDYHRIDAAGVAEVAIAAHVARDIVQLLAELLENATGYAPPTSRVRVSARRGVDNVTVTIFDEGIGMPADRVAELNDRLARPPRLTAELAGTMGLLVVARLAYRHQIGVELRSVPNGGTAALVALPMAILAPMPASVAPTGPMGIDPGRPVLDAVPMPLVPLGGPAAPVSPAVPSPSAGTVPVPVAPATAQMNGQPRATGTASVPGNGAGPAMLPRRHPGDLLMAGAGPADVLGFDDDPNRPPDPEITRARLGGLASGLAAAARLTRPPA